MEYHIFWLRVHGISYILVEGTWNIIYSGLGY
jgi:hypothetical protein